MKKRILFISMNSIHAQRWIENVDNAHQELFWWDITSSGKMNLNANSTQITDWRKRKIKYIIGEHFLRKKLPWLYNSIEHFLQVTISEQLETLIQQLKPDVIHSFEMQSCSYPILAVLNKHNNIPWIYSCWGNDLFYFKNFKSHKPKIKQVLQRVNFLQTDCNRDIEIAKELGFQGTSLEVIPGGGGFNLDKIQTIKLPINQRKIILVKGYEHKFGRAINVLKALSELKEITSNYEVVVFACHPIVLEFIKDNSLPFTVLSKEVLSHQEVLELMGKTLLYIGNSTSDGMPNTLLEALIMGAFPIQSNPGGATQEVIGAGNGLLIENPESVFEIKTLILKALSGEINFDKAFIFNSELAKIKLDYNLNRTKINKIYTDL
ncbi:glycosyltransferase [Flavobacterium sp.]|uniref:glycosyltransferase n=1 Tax=Flavobacterium sp. TaxID=239 RepID=UPI003BC663E2